MANKASVKQKTITINDTEYTLQKLVPREWIRLKNRCRDRQGNTNEEKLYDEILEYIVVSPQKKMDEFEDWQEFEQVITEAISFQTGATF